MIGFFFQMGLSNACLSFVLAITAMVVERKAKRPHVAYLLWLLVFVKLLTPPIVTIPLVTMLGQTDVLTSNDSVAISLSEPTWTLILDRVKGWLAFIWLLGSVFVFVWSMVRICRFNRLLVNESEVAPQELQTSTERIASRLGLSTIPMICTTSAHISPMVWWICGKVRIVIPKTLLQQLDVQQSRCILAHELAHVRRRDYLVRGLVWLACVCFWWNPVVWWAQRKLRATEEICCDHMVISCLNPKPKFYANSLLSAVEFLARPIFSPPAMASEINSGASLERRLKLIVSKKSIRLTSRWLQGIILLCGMLVLPVSIASARDYKVRDKKPKEAVTRRELTGRQNTTLGLNSQDFPEADNRVPDRNHETSLLFTDKSDADSKSKHGSGKSVHGRHGYRRSGQERLRPERSRSKRNGSERSQSKKSDRGKSISGRSGSRGAGRR
jgi:beta-lactamase regulating signal transducer with metallopeptidase domain